jgi:hypothetical protein
MCCCLSYLVDSCQSRARQMPVVIVTVAYVRLMVRTVDPGNKSLLNKGLHLPHTTKHVRRFLELQNAHIYPCLPIFWYVIIGGAPLFVGYIYL